MVPTTQDKTNKQVVTRFAPSPTGLMHVGGVRTALYAYLYARKHNGAFILRIEDTDKEREVTGAKEHIQESLKWLLPSANSENPWDGEIYVQSKRLNIYREYALMLVKAGLAYTDPYTKEELETFRKKAEENKQAFLYRNHRPDFIVGEWDETKPLRLKISDVSRTDWQDAVRGKLSAGAEALDDFILIKADGFPTYNFCHIVDDIEMNVTHVMRGEEFVASTPKFIALYKAIQSVYPERNIQIPHFVTLPPILGESGTKKLSKRDGAKDVLDYKKEGYLPSALVNFLAFQGWNPGGEKEVYTVDELFESFTLERIQKSGARWNPAKLDWFNKEHILKERALPDMGFKDVKMKEEFYKFLPDYIQEDQRFKDQRSIAFDTLFNRYMERISYFGELTLEPILSEFKIIGKPNEVDLLLILSDLEKTSTCEILDSIYMLTGELSDTDSGVWNIENLKTVFEKIIKEKGAKNVLHPLRTTLSREKKSLDPFSLLCILGREESVKRIQEVISEMKK